MHSSEFDPREDVYLLAAFLSDIERVLHPLPRGVRGQVRPEMVFPPALPTPQGPAGAMGPAQGGYRGGGKDGPGTVAAGTDQNSFAEPVAGALTRAEPSPTVADGPTGGPRRPDGSLQGQRLELPSSRSESPEYAGFEPRQDTGATGNERQNLDDPRGAVPTTGPVASERQQGPGRGGALPRFSAPTSRAGVTKSAAREEPDPKVSPPASGQSYGTRQPVEPPRSETAAQAPMQAPAKGSDTGVGSPGVPPRLDPPGRPRQAKSAARSARDGAAPPVRSSDAWSGSDSEPQVTGVWRSTILEPSGKPPGAQPGGGTVPWAAEDTEPPAPSRRRPADTGATSAATQSRRAEPLLSRPFRLELPPSHVEDSDAGPLPIVVSTGEQEFPEESPMKGDLGIWIASPSPGPLAHRPVSAVEAAPLGSARHAQGGLEPSVQADRPSDGHGGPLPDAHAVDDSGVSEDFLSEDALADWWEPGDPDWPAVALRVSGRTWNLSRSETRRIDERLRSGFLDRALLRRR